MLSRANGLQGVREIKHDRTKKERGKNDAKRFKAHAREGLSIWCYRYVLGSKEQKKLSTPS